MSEAILKALMQLFALISFQADGVESRRLIVKAFLTKQLNAYRAQEYLQLFDSFCAEQEKRLLKKERLVNRIASTSVKALKIASNVNEELTYYQKLVVVVQLVEFLSSSNSIDKIEKEFVDNVAQILHIDESDYRDIYEFISSPFSKPINRSNILYIAEQDDLGVGSNLIIWENLGTQVRILKLQSVNMVLMRHVGGADLTINGQLAEANRIHIFRPGTALRGRKMDPLFYSDVVRQFGENQSDESVVLDVKEIEYHFTRNKIGLQPLSFQAASGSLVGIMGDSGAGKTTLVNILCGIYKPTKGEVCLNNINIHTQSSSIDGLIGYVSQDDLLIEDLTVFQNLFFNAQLCFSDLTDEEIQQKVIKLLESLGLFDIRNNKVGTPLNKNISGGQRKRLNIALELIREPSVLFLDEPTSGLSSRDSENIIDLLKELTTKGKLIFVVIHQPSSDIFKMFSQLIVLDVGGYLIYNGDAIDSINYFKRCINHVNFEESECVVCGNVNAEQVLNIVNSQVLDEYGNPTAMRKIEPAEWYQKFKDYSLSHINTIKQVGLEMPKPGFKIPGKVKQFMVFLFRDVLAKYSNKQYLLINLIESPLLAFILAFLLRYYNIDAVESGKYTYANNPNITIYIIIAVIIALFVGLTVSAEEIINDRKILKREAFLKLSRLSYLFSKIAILVFLSAIQTFMFVLIGNSILGIQGMFTNYWLVLFSTSVFANLLGLLISDSLKKSVNIYILIPFLVIPQLILSGVFVGYDRLNPDVSSPNEIPWYGEVITSRWAFEAIAVPQFCENDYEKLFFETDKQKGQASFMKEYWVPAMVSHVERCKRLIKSQDSDNFRRSRNLIYNELDVRHLHVGLLGSYKGNITQKEGKISRKELDNLLKYLDKVKVYYRKIYNSADQSQDKLKVKMTDTPAEKAQFIELRDRYSNEDLERFVRNTNNFFSNKIIEVNGRLVQKTDPIFRDPENGIFNAHFFAPYKIIAGWHLSTFVANLLVIWVFNLLLFLALYYRLLIKLLNIGELLKSNAFYLFRN